MTSPSRTRTFINYRRQGGAPAARMLRQELWRHFPEDEVFLDVEQLRFAAPFPAQLRERLKDCELLIAVISPQWQDVRHDGGSHGRRLDDPHDWVRIEIETAIRQEKTILPVLMEGARMPRRNELPAAIADFADIHAMPFRFGGDFQADVQQILEFVGRRLGLLPAAVRGRRTFLSSAAKYFAGVMTGAAGALYWASYEKDVPDRTPGHRNRGTFLDAFLAEDCWGIVPGNTNQHLLAKGKPGMSPYVRSLWREMRNQCFRSLGKFELKKVGPLDPNLALDKDANLMFLGGPVANELTANLNEYDYREMAAGQGGTQHAGKKLPVFRDDGLLRWGFFCGHEFFGDWFGVAECVRQFDANKSDQATPLIERPLYGLIDRRGSGLRRPRVDGQGFLREDFLIITRHPHPSFAGRRIVSIGGMHGYSVAAFAQELEVALRTLDAETGGIDCFQMMVPAELHHDHAAGRTVAQLRWARLELEPLVLSRGR